MGKKKEKLITCAGQLRAPAKWDGKSRS